MDGNYAGTMGIRMDAADTIIYLDMPALVCLFRVWKRRISGKRVDLIPGCKDKVDVGFMRWIWSYRKRNHPANMKAIQQYAETKRAIILKNRKEVDNFLDSLKM